MQATHKPRPPAKSASTTEGLTKALEQIIQQADDSFALGSNEHRRTTLGRISDIARAALEKAGAV
ncbi:hypothetical protein [Noviherbaspirillum malthae]|uniref:hypothetical protein n=1 Tax=Noviherbaspirillum malthae TaxID=1260987 RepID=UPI00188F023F|nr:hypothetical protein [Noviherbaspirillum malthae]